MPSPLFNAFGNQAPSGSPLSNMSNFITRFNQFRQTFSGNPQQQIQQMLNSGQISQEQLNQASNMARQIMSFMGK